MPFGYRPPLSDGNDSDDHWPARTLTVRNRRTLRNLFIETKAAVEGDESTDEDDNDGADLEEFIVADDVYYFLNVSLHSISITLFDHHI